MKLTIKDFKKFTLSAKDLRSVNGGTVHQSINDLLIKDIVYSNGQGRGSVDGHWDNNFMN